MSTSHQDLHATDTSASVEDIKKLRELEESLWIAETRFNQELMNKVFAADFFEFGRSGRVYPRDAMLFDARDQIEINATLPLPAFHVRLITPDVAQTTYISEVIYDSQTERGNRSSI
jgi:hypothetical protein